MAIRQPGQVLLRAFEDGLPSMNRTPGYPAFPAALSRCLARVRGRDIGPDRPGRVGLRHGPATAACGSGGWRVRSSRFFPSPAPYLSLLLRGFDGDPVYFSLVAGVWLFPQQVKANGPLHGTTPPLSPFRNDVGIWRPGAAFWRFASPCSCCSCSFMPWLGRAGGLKLKRLVLFGLFSLGMTLMIVPWMLRNS